MARLAREAVIINDMQSEKYFSIVIPTRNRPGRLAECLGAVGELSYPVDRFEVIVVDDDSATDTEGAVAPFRPRLDLNSIVPDHWVLYRIGVLYRGLSMFVT